MKRLLLTWSLFLLGACETGPVQPIEAPASEAEKTQVVGWFADCVKTAAATLDDRVSDAMTIANVIISGPCRSQAEDAADVYSRGSDDRVRAMVRDQFLNGAAQDVAARLILEQRRRRATM